MADPLIEQLRPLGLEKSRGSARTASMPCWHEPTCLTKPRYKSSVTVPVKMAAFCRC